MSHVHMNFVQHSSYRRLINLAEQHRPCYYHVELLKLLLVRYYKIRLAQRQNGWWNLKENKLFCSIIWVFKDFPFLKIRSRNYSVEVLLNISKIVSIVLLSPPPPPPWQWTLNANVATISNIRKMICIVRLRKYITK